jgi:hypothetical protein
MTPTKTPAVSDTTTVPSLASALSFRARVAIHQVRRLVRDAIVEPVTRQRRGDALVDAPVRAQSITRLWTSDAPAERALQAGKVQNLRVAAARIDGVELPAGAVFSFWAQIGRPSRWRRYAKGRELREGCIVPSIGGGLCQLSNALYAVALGAGLEIVERHPHSQIVPGSMAEAGRDATVFWNHVDLRFRLSAALRIEAVLTEEELIIRLRGRSPVPAAMPTARFRTRVAITGRAPAPAEADVRSCETCGVGSCFRHTKQAPGQAPTSSRSLVGHGDRFGRTAWLVDEFWPEHDRYVQTTRRPADLIAVPVDGARRGKPNYRWRLRGFAAIHERRAAAALRSAAARHLTGEGAARQQALLRGHELLAASYAPLLDADVTHVSTMQSLLPFLWRDGHLGGRTFDVLMTRLPIANLQQTLDAAFARHPASPTLADFRAPRWLAEAERAALARARRIVTPHAEIAALFHGRAVKLPWMVPPPRCSASCARAGAPGDHAAAARRRGVVFPASTLARKGAYEMRQVARDLGLDLVVVARDLEHPDFWDGISIARRTFADADGANWLHGAALVVLPAFVESSPRALLTAIAAGVPVVASTACGLAGVPGITEVPAGDIRALGDAIANALERR